MKRIVVLGGSGFFGSLIVQKLRAAGLEPIVASRTSTEHRIDADNPEDLRAGLRQRDLVVDAAGPFQARTHALLDAAARIGFDVVDLNDSEAYARMVQERAMPIAAAGIRVLTSCSLFSTVSAAVLGLSSIAQPRRLTAYFRPAAALRSNRGLVASLLAALTGRSRRVRFPQPLGPRSGLLTKSADAVTLPPLFPTLREAELVVDSGIPGGNLAVLQSARRPFLRRLASRFQSAATAVAQHLGAKQGVLAYEIVATGGQKHQFFTGERVHLAAVLPAVMAVEAIVSRKFPHRGLIPPTQHVDGGALFDAMWTEGIAVVPPWGT